MSDIGVCMVTATVWRSGETKEHLLLNVRVFRRGVIVRHDEKVKRSFRSKWPGEFSFPFSSTFVLKKTKSCSRFGWEIKNIIPMEIIPIIRIIPNVVSSFSR